MLWLNFRSRHVNPLLLVNFLNRRLDISSLLVHMRRHPMHQLPITLRNITFLKIIEKLFHNTVINQQQQKNHSRQTCNNNRNYKVRIIPNLIGIELSWSIIFDLLAPDQTKHTYCQLEIQHDIDQCYLGCWRQRVIDHRHQPHVNDHQCCNICYFVVEIGTLNKGE